MTAETTTPEEQLRAQLEEQKIHEVSRDAIPISIPSTSTPAPPRPAPGSAAARAAWGSPKTRPDHGRRRGDDASLGGLRVLDGGFLAGSRGFRAVSAGK